MVVAMIIGILTNLWLKATRIKNQESKDKCVPFQKRE